MPLTDEKFFNLAVKNISKYGDTDIFPFPIENHAFHDLPDKIIELLKAIDADFENHLNLMPVLTAKDLSVVGYSGFRWGTQIEPIWNAYLLALVLSIAEELESKRLPATTVFSYRLKPNFEEGLIFDKEIGWSQFRNTGISYASSHDFVLKCDISDFYPRIYHHRLENALKRATTNSEAVRRIMKLLMIISDGVSYGLPVGGPAARILSEILLNRVDRLLKNESITFCRFVDDYLVFAKDRQSAHSSLISLTNFLLSHEGLSLQKNKTRVMTSSEFMATTDFSDAAERESPEEERVKLFKQLRLYYDPYSPTADDDYQKLSDQLKSFDIIGMLGRELGKSRIDEGLARRLINATKLLHPTVQNEAALSMIQNYELLYPIFPTVMIFYRGIVESLTQETREKIFESIRNLIRGNSYITQVPTNLAYALRVIADDKSEETEIILSDLYKQPLSMMIKRDIILIMGRRGADHWISNCRKNFATLTEWEKRAVLICSYILQDEGSHWRKNISGNLNAFQKITINWASASKQKNPNDWKIPV